MSASCANDRAAAAEALSGASALLVTTHVRMDADGLGSAVALCRGARARGAVVRLVLPDAVGGRCAYLVEGERPAGPEAFAALAAEADRVVVVDTGSLDQLEPVAGAVRTLREKLVVIDHHATADDIAAVAWRDPSAAATGVMVAELFGDLGWAIDAPTAEMLATAILFDTGWLRHASTDRRALRIVADLLAAGARAEEIYRRIYQSDRPERLRLLAAALASLELHASDRLAVMTLTRADFRAAGAGDDETEDFVNEPMRIATVELSAILIDAGSGRTRISLRSRRDVDVAALAGRFGGGGHARAAGFHLDGAPPAVKDRVLAACADALRRRPG